MNKINALILAALLMATSCFGVTLAWDASPDPDVAGYHLHYGTNGSGNYQVHIDVGNVTTNVVAGLLPNVTYWFVVTAYNTSGLESDPSNEISYTLDTAQPTLAITYPLPNSKLTNGNITMTGTSDTNTSLVIYQINNGPFLTAIGTTSWLAPVTLTIGTNTLVVESLTQVNGDYETDKVIEMVIYVIKPQPITGLKVISIEP